MNRFVGAISTMLARSPQARGNDQLTTKQEAQDTGDAIRNVARISNELAALAYASDFQAVAAMPPRLAELDLAACQADGLLLPVLLKGSNDYRTRSQIGMRCGQEFFDSRRFVELTCVVPENGYLLAPFLREQWDVRAAVRSLAERTNGDGPRVLFPGIAMAASPDRHLCSRYFDSHLSPLGYMRIIEMLIGALFDSQAPDVAIGFGRRLLKLDLSSRFSERAVVAMYPLETHLVEEDGKEGSLHESALSVRHLKRTKNIG